MYFTLNSTLKVNSQKEIANQMKKIISIFILLVAFSQMQAQEKKWTLQECVQHALENNISVKQSELNVELTDVDKLEAIGNFLPSINGSGSVASNTGLSLDPTTNTLQNTTLLSASGRINVGLTLFDGLRNVRQLQRAKISKLAAQYNLDKMQDDISLLIANSFLTVLLNKENLEVAKAQNLVTLEQLQRTNDLVDAGVLPRGDLLEIKATDSGEKRQIAVSENNVEVSLISLAQLLLIKDYKNFDIADSEYNIVEGEIKDKSVYEIIDAAKENRSEVKIAEMNVELANKDVQIAKGSYWPTLRAFFGYDTRYSDATSFRQSVDPDDPVSIQEIGVVQETGQVVVGEFPNSITRIMRPDPFIDQLYQNDGIGYGLQIDVPIFNGFTVRNNVKRSEINRKRSEYELEQAELDLESNVYQAYVDANGALKAYEAALAAQESQELAFEYGKERFDVGLTNAFDFSQSKLRFDNAKIEANITKFDYIFKLKVLELYFGIPASELKF